jgi:hypothetical protein
MNQITMSGMNLNHPEARFAGTTCRLPESFDDRLNFLFGRGLRQRIVIGKRDGARSNNFIPSTLGLRNGTMAFPWPVCTCFASSMRQLHACDATLVMNEARNPGQWLDVIVSPDPKVLRADAAFRENSRRLGKHQSGAANRAAAQVHEMPVISISVGARVLTHRRNEHSIRKLNLANHERIKQVSHTFFPFFTARYRQCGRTPALGSASSDSILLASTASST